MDYKSLPVESSGQYKIQLKFLQPKTHSSVNQFDVSLVTHCTSNHLHNLLDLVNHWKGPISLGMLYKVHVTHISILTHLSMTCKHLSPEVNEEIGFHSHQLRCHCVSVVKLVVRLEKEDQSLLFCFCLQKSGI